MNTIILCNVPNLDINHNHSFTFRDLKQQIEYFFSKKVLQFDDTKYHRVGNTIKIPLPFDDINLMRCNYLIVQNHNQLSYGKTYFYFITNKEYVNSETTKLSLKLDVIQTYLFDINFGQCYIERHHYNPYDSNGDINIDIVDRPENIEVGEYIVDSVETIYDYNDILDVLDNPCSILEMLIALAYKIEVDIACSPDYINRTGKWFSSWWRRTI